MKLRSDAAKLSILWPGGGFFFFFSNHFSKINKSTSGAWSTKATTAVCKNEAVNSRTEVPVAEEEGDGVISPPPATEAEKFHRHIIPTLQEE